MALSVLLLVALVSINFNVEASVVRSTALNLNVANRMDETAALSTNCQLLDRCEDIKDAVVVNETDFRNRFEMVFGNCYTWAPNLEQKHCDTFIEYAYLSIRKDTLGQDCLTPAAFTRIIKMMVEIFRPGPQIIAKPRDDVLTQQIPPTQVLGVQRSLITNSTSFPISTRYTLPEGTTIQEYLAVCPAFPTYHQSTVAYPMCARATCAAYAVMPHLRAAEHESCCSQYALELGYWASEK